MKDLINKLYKNHGLIYKGLLFIATTFVIVYLFPKSGTFKYDFVQGKPWQSENLYAPFDFAISKSEDELNEEIEEVKLNSSVFFQRDINVKTRVLHAYDNKFSSYIKDTLSRTQLQQVNQKGKSVLASLYDIGILSDSYSFGDNKTVIILEERLQKATLEFNKLIAQGELRETIQEKLNNEGLSDLAVPLGSLFFEVIEPNLEYKNELTQKVMQEELDRISRTRGKVEKETLIVSKGEVVEGDTFKILESLKNEYKSKVWNESNYNWVVAAYTLLVALALLMLLLFLRKYRFEVFKNNTKVTFIFFNIAFMVLLTTLVVNYNSIYVYVVPICILPLVLKAFFDARLGLFAHVITVLLLGFIVPNNYEYMFLQIMAGIVTILTVSELYKRANLFISVGQITLIYIIAYFAFFVIHEGSIETIKWETFGLFILCGLATLFVQPLIYVYEKLFGLVSDVSLLELSDTNTKLLKDLSNKAPGTFHHSLNVANLAEASANEIGANAMLLRVGALYHDIGKMKNPTFFTENQSAIINPHDELSNKESARIIIDHVIDGIEIAKKNNLPDRVIDFIRTHHGTSLVYFFYSQEKNTEDLVDEEDFRYPGPKPFSKETAILMMCDSVEAASKSLKEPTTVKIDAFVENIINKQMEEGQFLNANITFKEIQSIKKVLKQKLANIYHLRIEYPE
ncbi:MAG: HDIG domain-containing protein [Bacteroidia bacterium]|nr:HDIG domain-containing protein [Bacteroidia bacterium]